MYSVSQESNTNPNNLIPDTESNILAQSWPLMMFQKTALGHLGTTKIPSVGVLIMSLSVYATSFKAWQTQLKSPDEFMEKALIF
jgi:hypothetical protein